VNVLKGPAQPSKRVNRSCRRTPARRPSSPPPSSTLRAIRILEGDGLLNSGAFTVKNGTVTLNLIPS
jgi:hypothetical protein